MKNEIFNCFKKHIFLGYRLNLFCALKVMKMEEEDSEPVPSPEAASPSSVSSSSSVAVSVITSPQPRFEAAAEGALPMSAQPTSSAALPRSVPPEQDATPLLSSLIGPPSIENLSSDSAELGASASRGTEPSKVEPLSPPGLPHLPTAFLPTPSPRMSSHCSSEAHEPPPPAPMPSSRCGN